MKNKKKIKNRSFFFLISFLFLTSLLSIKTLKKVNKQDIRISGSELSITSFCENNLLPEILMFCILTFLRVFMLNKLVKNKNEIIKKKLLFLIPFLFFTNHIELFPSVGPSILSLALHLKMGHPSLSHPLLISACTYLTLRFTC